MIAREAKRSVFRSVAAILEGELLFDALQGGAEWLRQDPDGAALAQDDHERMRQAAQRLAAELRRRAQGTG